MKNTQAVPRLGLPIFAGTLTGFYLINSSYAADGNLKRLKGESCGDILFFYVCSFM
jgi:hypothetical protein